MHPLPSSYRETDPRHRLILALDFPTAEEALHLLDLLGEELRWVKVGMELFTAEGPSIVQRLFRRGYRVFLDLKFHDIPNTMAQGAKNVARLGARLCTVHAMAGEGVGAAVRAVMAGEGAGAADRAVTETPGAAGGGIDEGSFLPSDLLPPGVLAVTVLTSHGERELQELLGTPLSSAELVARLATAAVRAGATGVVASPLEIELLRQTLGKEPLLVIPGIRPAGSDSADQRRVATPGSALRLGADFLVVGRPITRAGDPKAQMGRILDEMAAAV